MAKLLVRLACLFLIFALIYGVSMAENEGIQTFGQMIRLRFIMEQNGFTLSRPVSTHGCQVSFIFKKGKERRDYQAAFCFENGQAIRCLLWADKLMPKGRVADFFAKILIQTIEIKGERLSPEDAKIICGLILQKWKIEGREGFIWKDAMVVETDSDEYNRKIKIEPYNPSAKPML